MCGRVEVVITVVETVTVTKLDPDVLPTVPHDATSMCVPWIIGNNMCPPGILVRHVSTLVITATTTPTTHSYIAPPLGLYRGSTVMRVRISCTHTRDGVSTVLASSF